MAEPKISAVSTNIYYNKSIDDRKSRYRESTEMENGMKPGRSDSRLSMEEERGMEAKTREYFNGVAPKRHTKPQRSEFSAHYIDKVNGEDDCIPEFAEFQRLESDPRERLAFDGHNGNISEEFVETKYYEDLNCVDKQHHTTGTGFIKMENGDCKGFNLAADSATAACCHGSGRGNPATNEWIPDSNDLGYLISSKPNRSDN